MITMKIYICVLEKCNIVLKVLLVIPAKMYGPRDLLLVKRAANATNNLIII